VDFYRFSDIDRWHAAVGSAPKREVAHFSFDAPLVASMPAGWETILQNLIQHGVMKCSALPRGEWRGNGKVSGG
jgi:hypothetical protein